ncbi:hypothetical protein GN956_G9958 [Arapaima gigas]
MCCSSALGTDGNENNSYISSINHKPLSMMSSRLFQAFGQRSSKTRSMSAKMKLKFKVHINGKAKAEAEIQQNKVKVQ